MILEQNVPFKSITYGFWPISFIFPHVNFKRFVHVSLEKKKAKVVTYLLVVFGTLVLVPRMATLSQFSCIGHVRNKKEMVENRSGRGLKTERIMCGDLGNMVGLIESVTLSSSTSRLREEVENCCSLPLNLAFHNLDRSRIWSLP